MKMDRVLTLIKTYNVARHSSEKALKFILERELRELNVKITEISFTKEGYTEIVLQGEDEIIAQNYIRENYGTKRSIADINEGDILYGRFTDTEQVNFGLFIDVGVESSTKNIDALYPLFEIRNQLAKGEKAPLKQIVKAYGIIENLPMFFEVTEKQIIGSKLRVKISEETLEWFKEPMKDNKESLIITGATRRMLKQALIQTNHFEDIEVMERIGLLEYRLVCKKGTRADGLIPEIGHLLGNAKIGAQVPKRLKEILKNSE